MNFSNSGVSSFTIPPTVITGIGAADQVGDQAKRLGGEKALVVTDPGISKLGYADGTVKQLNAVGIDTSIFEDVTPDPTLQNVHDGLEQYRSDGCNLIVSIGGR